MRGTHFQFPLKVTKFLMVAVTIITTGIFVSSSVLNQHHVAVAQQQSLVPKDISFDIDNVTFSHHMTPINGIQLHYVIGGHGDPVVLLHGWPETWYEWRHVMPALAKNYTVIAPDLRGLGDSSKPLTGYDGKTTAEELAFGYYILFICSHAYSMRQRKVLNEDEWTGWLQWTRNCFKYGTIGEQWKQIQSEKKIVESCF